MNLILKLKNNNILKGIGYTILLLLLYLASGQFLSSRHIYLLLIIQLVVFILTFLNRGSRAFLYGIIGFLLILILGMLLEHDISRGGLYLIFLPLIYFLTKSNLHKKWRLLLIIGLIFINSHLLFPNYFAFIISLETENVIGLKISELKLTDSNGNLVKLPEEGYLILDFWTTSCGVCFKEFPKFEAIAKKYENREDVHFYAINVPTRMDKSLEEIAARINRYNYDFKNLYAIDRKEVEALIETNTYPKILVIKNGEVIHSKLQIYSPQIIINNLEYELKKLLN